MNATSLSIFVSFILFSFIKKTLNIIVIKKLTAWCAYGQAQTFMMLNLWHSHPAKLKVIQRALRYLTLT